MEQRSIGNDVVGRVSVGAIGLGAMPLSTKGPRPSPEAAGQAASGGALSPNAQRRQHP